MPTLNPGVGNVRTPGFNVGTELGNLGEFLPLGWSIGLNAEHLENRGESKRALTNLYNTVAHELRHAEQIYAAATYHASAVSQPNLTFIPVYYPYFHLPHQVRLRAMQDASVEGSEVFELGKLVSAIDNNHHIEETRDHLDSMMNRYHGTAEYDRYHKRYRYELPLERDAYAFGDTVETIVEGCLPPSLKFDSSARGDG